MFLTKVRDEVKRKVGVAVSLCLVMQTEQSDTGAREMGARDLTRYLTLFY